MHDDHDHSHGSEMSPMVARVRALETVLTDKGYVDPQGSRPDRRNLRDQDWTAQWRAGCGPSLDGSRLQGAPYGKCNGSDSRVGFFQVCKANTWSPWRTRTPCTTSSFVPSAPAIRRRCWACLRSGISRRPIAPERCLILVVCLLSSASPSRHRKEIRVWHSTAEIRYLVIPQRPSGTERWPVEELATLVTRDSMIGTGLALNPQIRGKPS